MSAPQPGRIHYGWLLCFLAAVLAGGCRGPEYRPEIAVTQARPIIDARAEFHGLYPAQALVSGARAYGLDAQLRQLASRS